MPTLSNRLQQTKLSDLKLMGRLKNLAWLSASQLKSVDDAMTVKTVKAKGVIYSDDGKPSPYTHILLLGTAQLSHLNSRGPRAVAILSPGLLFKFPAMPPEIGRNFELIALNDCKVAVLTTERFIRIALGIAASDYAKVADAGNGRLGALLARYPGFVGLGLLHRLVLALLELANDFGVRDARGVLLRIGPTHQQIADLVGASRSKVTKLLSDLERRQIIVREKRKLVLIDGNARKFLESPVIPLGVGMR